jgi:hypothetical protein
MSKILIDDRDQKFVLFEQLKIGKFSESKLYSDFYSETYTMVINEAQKLAQNAMMPVNAEGDSEGCTLKDVKFSVPKSFHPRPILLKIRVRQRMFIIKEQMPCKWLPHPGSGID